MSRTVQNVVLAVVGVILVTASSNGLVANLLSPAMQWPTVASGLVLVVLALLGSFRGLRLAELGAEEGEPADEGDGRLPCREQRQIFGLARVWLSVRCSRRNLLYESSQERSLLLKVVVEFCGITLPDQCTETLPCRAPG